MDNELEERLKQIDTEDFIWPIYIGIIFLSWYANDLERKSLIDNDEISKNKYQNIMIFIFIVLAIIYFYFFKKSLDEFNKLKKTDSSKKKEYAALSTFASLLLVISGLIFLYIAIDDQDLNAELAFN